jgi:hypothetical protein
MALISVSLPSDGSTADVSDYNSPITTIVGEVNGNLDNANIKSGAAIDGLKLADTSVTAAKMNFSTFVAKTASLNTALSPITTTLTTIGNITVPEAGTYLIIIDPVINWNNAALNTHRTDIYNLTTTTVIKERVTSFGPGQYVSTIPMTTIATFAASDVIHVRMKIDAGTAASNYTTSPGSITILRVGTKTS